MEQEFQFALMQILMQRLLQIFTHDAIAVLLWHLQNGSKYRCQECTYRMDFEFVWTNDRMREGSTISALVVLTIPCNCFGDFQILFTTDVSLEIVIMVL